MEIPERVIRTGNGRQQMPKEGLLHGRNESDLEKKWPILLGTHPDFVKTYLLYSDQLLVDGVTIPGPNTAGKS